MNVHPNTFKDVRATVKELAVESFKDHVLKKVTDERWKCARADGSWQYGFFVILCPGAVIIYGDVGEGIFRHSGGQHDWILGSVDSPDYLLEKLQRRDKEFYVGDAVAWAKEMVKESEEEGITEGKAAELLTDVLKAAGHQELTHEHFYHLWSDLGFDDCGTIGIHDTAGNLWLVEALRTFVRLVKAEMAA